MSFQSLVSLVYSSIHPRLDLLQQQTRKGVPVLDNTLQLLLFMIPRYSLALKGKLSRRCILGATWGFFQQGQGILTILLQYQGIATQSHSWGHERRSIVRWSALTFCQKSFFTTTSHSDILTLRSYFLHKPLHTSTITCRWLQHNRIISEKQKIRFWGINPVSGCQQDGGATSTSQRTQKEFKTLVAFNSR